MTLNNQSNDSLEQIENDLTYSFEQFRMAQNYDAATPEASRGAAQLFLNRVAAHFRKENRALLQDEILKAREIFIPVRGYEGLYEVSNTGKVRSLPGGRRSGTQLAPANRGQGYMAVSLSNNGQVTMYTVHRLVAEAFISNPLNKPCVNHLDGNKKNNDVTNLEWCTLAENNVHAVATGLNDCIGMGNSQSKLTDEQVKEIYLSRGKVRQHVLAKRFGVSEVLVSQVQLGKIWTHITAQLQSQLTKSPKEGE